jgi:predicted ATPase
VERDDLLDLPKLPAFLSGASLLRFERRQLAEPAYTERVPRVGTDGAGLAAALTDLALTWPERFQAIQAALREIIPAVLRVRLVRTPVERVEWESITVDKERISRPVTRQYAGHEIVFDMRGAPDVPARLASEGTLLVLGLLTVLHGPNEGRLVLLDDIDRALHPRAQSDLVKQLRLLLQLHPDLQILATSHSPYLLDELGYQEILLTTLQDDGSALCAPLTEHSDYPRWRDHMLPGEFWSMVAEDWIKRRGGNGDG